MKNDRNLWLENLNLIHESNVRSELIAVMNEIFPEKYSCFIDLFTELKELNTILVQLSSNTDIQSKRIETQQTNEITLEKERNVAILDQMIQQIMQVKDQINQGLSVDKNSLNLALADYMAGFMQKQPNSINVEQKVSDSTNLLANYQQKLQEMMQKLNSTYNNCQNVYSSLMQNVKIDERHIEHLKQIYLLVCRKREKNNISNEIPSFETICSILEAYVECMKAIYSNLLTLVNQVIVSYDNRELTIDNFSKKCSLFNLELSQDAHDSIYEDLPRILTVPATPDNVKVFSSSIMLGYKLLEKLLMKKNISNEELEMYKNFEYKENLRGLHSYRFGLDKLRSHLLAQNYELNQEEQSKTL